MRIRSWHQLRWLAAPVAAAGILFAGAGPAPAVRRPVVRYWVYVYKVTVGIKGGESISTSPTSQGGCDPVGDALADSDSGSYHVDGTMSSVMMVAGRPPHGLGPSGGNGGAHVVGSWSDQGTKVTGCNTQTDTNTTGPFTCSGKIGTDVSGVMNMAVKRVGSKSEYTLHAPEEEIHEFGASGCPVDASPGWTSAIDPAAYISQFSIAAGMIGHKQITMPISGPLAENRIYVKQLCPTHGTCNVAFQGVVKFTLQRTIKGYGF